MNDPSDDTLRQWLLRRLPATHADALERRLFEDDAFAERLRDAENDLFDDAARGRLGVDERAAFDAQFRTTVDDRARFEFAHAVARLRAERAVGSVATTRRRRWRSRRPWHAAALLAIAIGLGALIRFALVPQAESDSATVPTLTLHAATLRGSAADRIVLVLSGSATVLRLQMEIDISTAENCDVQVLAADGQVAFRAVALGVRRVASHRYVETMVPVAQLVPGPLEFELRCNASERRTWAVQIAPAAS